MTVTIGQLGFEVEHLRAKLAARSPSDLFRLPELGTAPPAPPAPPHPLFDVIEGPVEAWERGAVHPAAGTVDIPVPPLPRLPCGNGKEIQG
jgi:hypothetical protein